MKKIFCVFAVMLVLTAFIIPSFAAVSQPGQMRDTRNLTVNNDLNVDISCGLASGNTVSILAGSTGVVWRGGNNVHFYFVLPQAIMDLVIISPVYFRSFRYNSLVLNVQVDYAASSGLYYYYIDWSSLTWIADKEFRFSSATAIPSDTYVTFKYQPFYQAYLNLGKNIVGHSFEWMTHLTTDYLPVTIFVSGSIVLSGVVLVIIYIFKRCKS